MWRLYAKNGIPRDKIKEILDFSQRIMFIITMRKLSMIQ